MMKIVVSFLAVILAMISCFVFGLYSYETLFSIVFSVLVLSVSIGFQKKRLPTTIFFLGESVIFCILIVLGMEEITQPVFQQSIFLSIFIMVFIVVHISFSLFGLYIVIKNKEFTWGLRALIPFILAFALFAVFLVTKSNLILSFSLALLIFSEVYHIWKKNSDSKKMKNK